MPAVSMPFALAKLELVAGDIGAQGASLNGEAELHVLWGVGGLRDRSQSVRDAVDDCDECIVGRD